jgi:hypothetical protein
MKYFLRYLVIGVIYFMVCQFTYIEFFVDNDKAAIFVAAVLQSYFWVISWNLVIPESHKNWINKNVYRYKKLKN